MSDTTHGLYIWIVLFWLLVTIISRFFGQQILYNDFGELRPEYANQDNFGFLQSLFISLDKIPVINFFTPLFAIMFFSTIYVSWVISLIMDFMLVMSAFVVWAEFRGT